MDPQYFGRFQRYVRDSNRYLLLTEGLLNRLRCQTRIVANELGASIDDHLRRVDAAQSKAAGVGVLAIAEKARGVGIGPATRGSSNPRARSIRSTAPQRRLRTPRCCSSASAGGQLEQPSEVKAQPAQARESWVAERRSRTGAFPPSGKRISGSTVSSYRHNLASREVSHAA